MTQEVPVRAFIVSVFVLRPGVSGMEVLLMRRANPPAGAWCQVAGKIEDGEMAWQAGLREMQEETGLTPERYYSADAFEFFYEPRRDQMTVAPCFAAIVAQDAVPVLNAEHDTHCWVSFDEAITRVSFQGQRRVLREIAETFGAGEPHPDLRIPL